MYEEHTKELLKWVENHNQQGLYRSNADHPIWGVENQYILPHTFQYYGIILGYLSLYKKLNNQKYLNKAEEAASVLCSLQKFSGQFKYDTFEFNTPKTQGLTLIHNALPSLALLELYQVTKKQRYLKVAKKNIAWFYCRLWNGKFLTGCVNQDLCAAEALAKLYVIEKKEVMKERTKRIADTALTLQIKEGPLKGGFIRGFNETNIVIPWYDAKTARSYLNISKYLNEEKYRTSAQETAQFLEKNVTKKGLIHWYRKNQNWKKIEEPHLIAPTGEVYSLWNDLRMKCTPSLLSYQKKDGSFPLSDKHTNNKPNLGWNQFMFIYLTSVIEKELA